MARVNSAITPQSFVVRSPVIRPIHARRWSTGLGVGGAEEEEDGEE